MIMSNIITNPNYCQAWQNGVMFSIVDSYIYGNNIFTILSIWILPSWIMFHLNITTNAVSDKSVRLAFDKKVQWSGQFSFWAFLRNVILCIIQ